MDEKPPVFQLLPEAHFAAGPAYEAAWAIRRGEKNLLDQLLTQHPELDPDYRGPQGMTLGLWALLHHHLDCLRVLVNHGADLSRRLTLLSPEGPATATHLLNIAVLDPADDPLTTLLLLGANPSTKDERGVPALHTAILTENFPRMRQLVSHGADLNATDRAGVTAITLLARLDNFEQVYYLLQQGADHRKPHDEVALWTQENDTSAGEALNWQIKVKQKLMARGVRFPVPRPGAARYAQVRAEWEKTLEGRDWRILLSEFGADAEVVGQRWVARSDEAFAALRAWMARTGIAEPPA